MPVATPRSPMDTRVEMFQRGGSSQPFFNMKDLAARLPRPLSDATEIFDVEDCETDFEDDDSEAGDKTNSPRFSLNSAGRRSETTLSSFEEVYTPVSTSGQEYQGFNFDLTVRKSVEGPTGPHLFRSSINSNIDNDEYILAMSPMTPKPTNAERAASIAAAPQVPQIPQRQQLKLLTDVASQLDLDQVPTWTPRQVSRWMFKAGFEQSIAEKFQENDISGAILITLKFEDLRELDIPSFGLRTKVWNEIHVLRGSAPSSPKPATPIDETAFHSPSTEFVKSPRTAIRRKDSFESRRDRGHDCDSDDGAKEQKKRKKSRNRLDRLRVVETPITPLESVSIVGIEQLMPKPHVCKRGENCSKWRRQQRLIEAFNNGHPISPEHGGSVWVAGNPGNPNTAEAVAMAQRPTSDAVPSVVASSDVLGPGSKPTFGHLEEASLRNLESRDPQDNVKRFIEFQHMDPYQVAWSSEVPPTPPYEMFPALHNSNGHTPSHRNLPRLAIPPPRPTPARSASANAFTPYSMERVEAMSPELRNQTTSPNVYRFGTPFSDMDIPVTAINLGPVSRDASQSVPPNMSFRAPITSTTQLQRTQSRASARRPSFMAMPRVDENIAHGNSIAPPRPQRGPPTHRTIPPFNHPSSATTPHAHQPESTSPARSQDDISHSGYMKKRKTRLLRHEWHEHHFTLSGTQLAMTAAKNDARTLECIDVDDYAIACSSAASGSKLNAAFRAMNISRGGSSWNGSKKDDTAAFAFQLIPATDKERGAGGSRLRKRESALPGGSGNGDGREATGNSGKGATKTHYFAVKTRDERIDWMRELMLSKALKQKGEGYEVRVNGNVI